MSSHLEGSLTPYVFKSSGIYRVRNTRNGAAEERLTNFVAEILSDVICDDGLEVARSFEVQARLNGRSAGGTVNARQFPTLTWPTDLLGPEAVVYAGHGVRDHVRAAIQLFSGRPKERLVFGHSGWRCVRGRWLYLHGSGAIGAEGLLCSPEVMLPPELDPFRLPAPPSGAELVRVIRLVLELIEIAPPQISLPLFAAAWRAPLGGADFSLHLTGATGVFKSELAAIVQQHFGKGFNARKLPGSWSSTSNALEVLAFTAKDAVLVVDDFAPSGTQSDVRRFHRDADRLLRAQGNRSGRSRLRADSSFMPARAPRGLLISTGEDVPAGQSLRARMFVLDVAQGDVDVCRLGVAQERAAAGVYTAAMSGYLQWLAGRYPPDVSAEFAALRALATTQSLHRRAPEVAAGLAIGWMNFTDFARDAGALTVDEAAELRERCWATLLQVAAQQSMHQVGAEPAHRFVSLLASALARGSAHVASGTGERPQDPEVWGWWRTDGSAFQPRGQRIGWVDGPALYLEPGAALAAAQEVGRALGEPLAISQRTLHKRLYEKGLIASTEPSRATLTTRCHLEGTRRAVLHLPSTVLAERSARPNRPG